MIRSIAAFSLATLMAASAYLFAADSPAAPDEEISGQLELQFNDCFNPARTGPETTYLVRNLATFEDIELDVKGIDVQLLKPGKAVRLQGQFQANAKSERKPFKVTGVSYEETGTNAKSEVGGASAVAKAAPAISNLTCLVIHANTLDTTVNMTKVNTFSNMLFASASNASNAMDAASYGHFTLQHGATIIVTVNTNAATTERSPMTSAIEQAARDAGYDPADYDRYLVCCPDGTLENGGGSSWTAYGSYGSSGRTVWSYGWTGAYFDGIIHEMGHNFGFRHSGQGSNEYADRTCAMGYSHSGTTVRSATYSVVKKVQHGWFDPFPGSYTNLTSDATLYLHPISVSPDTTPGMRGVRLKSSKYYVSYRRLLLPYAWLRYSSDQDKVYVHENTSFFSASWRVGDLTEGGNYMAGTTNVIFEVYGSNSSYVAVSIDFPDTNTKPVADAQAVVVNVDTPKAITLTGSDANTNALSYAVFLEPSNGSLSGIPPDLTYTPGSGYLGADSFVFSVDDGQISSFATVSINVSLPQVSVNATDALAAEDAQDPGAWTLSHTGNTSSPLTVYFSMSGSAIDPDDYSINTNSPITIPAGQSNMTVTLTPVDDSVFDEVGENAILTIDGDAAYVIGNAGDTITILDNDFLAPVVTNQGATAISNTIAALSGEVTTGGGVTGWICWGDNDAGTDSTGDWDNVEFMGSVTKSLPFSTNVTGLITNATYWYRCYVTNSVGADWSDAASLFSGSPAGGIGGGGDPVSGAYYEWDAARNSGANTWTSTTANAYIWTFATPGQTPVTVTDSRFDLLTKAYLFPGSIDESGNASFQNSGSGSAQPATFEFVLDVDAVNGIIFETGATGDGLQFDYFDGDIRGYIKESEDTLVSYTMTTEDLARFTHVVFVADQINDVHQLYVDGELKSQKAWTGSPWAGSDGSALGGYSGNSANTNVGDFNGQMALFRYYDGKAFTAEEVTTNFMALSSAGAVIVNQAPTLITGTGAVFNAALYTGVTNYSVDVYWGTTDGGTNPGTWASSVNLGNWTNVSTLVSHSAVLSSGQTYYYTFRASNSSNVWGVPSWRFATLGDVSVTTNYTVPYIWLSGINPVWSNDYEFAVLGDQDGDGFLTWQEYWSGTDPTDSNSHLRIDQLLPSATNIMLVWQHSQVNAGLPAIQIQNRASLSAGIWTNIGFSAPADGTNTWSAPLTTGPYFRLSVPVSP